ncbi:GNAT family N-acetyltransferase [Streptomyces sp. NPDC050535]|uniref:GNAT family N-acetyltransferase n=1 Tax=Streptomyces sp. NPDC050535 TaxID=3365626 RepID=UPI0037B003F4
MRTHRPAGPLLIRTALPSEAPTIAGLHARARATYYPDGLPQDGFDWPALWRGTIERPDAHVLCAVRDGTLVGIASFRTAEAAPADTVTLFQFHVDPGHWRTGIGVDLHEACVEQWRADRKRTAALDVHVDNRRARAFYARQGWTQDREPEADEHHVTLRFAVRAGAWE